jgi:hypothetical protein
MTKSQILLGKGGDNGERIETRRKTVEHKTFLNGDGATSKEMEDKTKERQSKRKERLGTGTESQYTCNSTHKKRREGKKASKEKKQKRTSDERMPLWHR